MVAGGSSGKKISAASARAHTRKSTQSSSFRLPSGMLKKLLAVFLIGFIAWAYQAIKPPSPKICGSADGPLITAPRIKLRDGRHLAYKEHGVPKDEAKYKIVYIHGFHTCRYHDVVSAKLSADNIEGLGVYIVSFDRPGYGESDPDPKQTVKSRALDVEELADQLRLGSKFYVVGFSMGAQVVWPCLKYIPHRLAGAVLLAPAVNYWWSGLPANLSKEVYNQLLPQDQWALRIAHYVPWLTYWWNTQRFFPVFSVISGSPLVYSRQDLELIDNPSNNLGHKEEITQQGEFESLHRDMMVAFGTWEFEPSSLENPFPNGEGSVHLWQGDEDRLVPHTLQRYIVQQLPWIKYHEIPGSGHKFPYVDGMIDTIVTTLLGDSS